VPAGGWHACTGWLARCGAGVLECRWEKEKDADRGHPEACYELGKKRTGVSCCRFGQIVQIIVARSSYCTRFLGCQMEIIPAAAHTEPGCWLSGSRRISDCQRLPANAQAGKVVKSGILSIVVPWLLRCQDTFWIVLLICLVLEPFCGFYVFFGIQCRSVADGVGFSATGTLFWFLRDEIAMVE